MTESEFTTLISLDKQFIFPKSITIPHDKTSRIYKLRSVSTKDSFLLDCDRRGTYELKYKNQLRHGKDFALVRLEVNAPPHINPDGTITSRNHIHIYKENFGLAWAYDLDSVFSMHLVITNPMALFTEFCEYCKIDLSNIALQGVI